MDNKIFKLQASDFLGMLKPIILILSVAVGWVLLKNTSIGASIQDYEWVRLQITQSGPIGPLLFILAGGIATTFLFFPRLLLCSIAGFVFGFKAGILWGLAGTVLGCIITYYYAQAMGRTFVEKRIPPKIAKYEPMLRKHSFSMILMIRFFPIGNNLLTNLLAGVSNIKPLPYFLGSAIGYLPQTLIFALIGSGIRKETWIRSAVSCGLFLVTVVIMLLLLKRFRTLKKSLV
jgi:uncharacterized membrane protein YdjX (TVP38/TMEM64 family)